MKMREKKTVENISLIIFNSTSNKRSFCAFFLLNDNSLFNNLKQPIKTNSICKKKTTEIEEKRMRAAECKPQF
jgi:hypothetical protein